MVNSYPVERKIRLDEAVLSMRGWCPAWAWFSRATSKVMTIFHITLFAAQY
jgi:hypothetical protein